MDFQLLVLVKITFIELCTLGYYDSVSTNKNNLFLFLLTKFMFEDLYYYYFTSMGWIYETTRGVRIIKNLYVQAIIKNLRNSLCKHLIDLSYAKNALHYTILENS